MDTAKKYFWGSLLISTALVGFIVLFNVTYDIYGLFQRIPKKDKVVNYDERACKYLMAFRYIPQNFNAVWLGPSLSANINTEKVKGLDVFNLSVMGANISEEKAMVEKVLAENNRMKVVIICLNPYITKEHGFRADQLGNKIYYAAFGSYGLYKEYLLKLVRHFDLLPGKYPKDEYNPYGCNNYDKLFAAKNVKEKIDREIKLHQNERIEIDSIAVNELQKLDTDLIHDGIKVIYYFHPVPYRIYHARLGQYEAYKDLILRKIDTVNLIDFNDERFSYFTKDYTNYLDHGHLNKKGRMFLLSQLQKKIDLALKN